MIKRILVTGTGGFIGTRIMAQLMDRWERDEILHTSESSDTRYIHAQPDESYQANVCLPVYLAEAAKNAGAKLVAFSSDQVYTGQKDSGPFGEDFLPHPINVYGQHKLEAEGRVLDLLPEAVMLRATWMYDLPGFNLPVHGNMVMNLLSSALNGSELTFSVNDLRAVTYVRQVIEMLVPALELPGGVYNFGSENPLNMYDTAIDFAKVLNIKPNIIKDEFSPARSLSIDCGKLKRNGIFFDDTQRGIRRLCGDYRIIG